MANATPKSGDSYTFTVGKLDAGMAILLGERAHLIEFPSILLPPGATAGSIVNIAVHQNHTEEEKRDKEFWDLQKLIEDEFCVNVPEKPVLKLRNVTQTSVTLEWPTLSLATAKLRSLDLYRNNVRLAAIPSPNTNTSTKVSGLEINAEYSFQLVLRTTAGTYPSNIVRVRTHTMQDTSGIVVCFGTIEDPSGVLLDNCKMALREMGARWSDKIEIDTTHFICTTPAATPQASDTAGVGAGGGAPGVLYQRALQLSIPVLQAEWILACFAEKRMVPVSQFYLGASSPLPSGSFSASTASFRHQGGSQSISQAPPPRNATQTHGSARASLPPPLRSSPTSPTQPTNSPFINQPAVPVSAAESDVGGQNISRLQNEDAEEVEFQTAREHQVNGRDTEKEKEKERENAAEAAAAKEIDAKNRKRRSGTMNKEFKFPSPNSSPTPEVPQPPGVDVPPRDDAATPPARIMTPSNIEVPAPPPVMKDKGKGKGKQRAVEGEDDSYDDEVGETVEIEL